MNAEVWQMKVTALTDDRLQQLAVWRGLSQAFCEALRARSLIGLHDGCLALPVHDANGNVVGCHHRLESDGTWRFCPLGLAIAPLVIGNPKSAHSVMVFESQWDAFALMDKLGWHLCEDGLADTAILVTRGASNGRVIRGHCGPQSVVYALPQNDRPQANGKVASEIWLNDVCTYAGREVRNVVTPKEHKDFNSWTQAGATAEDIRSAIASAKAVAPLPQVCEFGQSVRRSQSSAPICRWPEPMDAAAHIGLVGE